MIEHALFLAAFFSFIWFLMLGLSWFVIPSYSNEKKSVQKIYLEYLAKEGVVNKIFMWLFIIFNSYILFKAKGSIVALFFILLFIFYKKVA